MPEKGKDPPFKILITCGRFPFPKYVAVEFGREEEVGLLNEEWFQAGEMEGKGGLRITWRSKFCCTSQADRESISLLTIFGPCHFSVIFCPVILSDFSYCFVLSYRSVLGLVLSVFFSCCFVLFYPVVLFCPAQRDTKVAYHVSTQYCTLLQSFFNTKIRMWR